MIRPCIRQDINNIPGKTHHWTNIKEVFQECKYVLGLKQPRNVLRQVAHAAFERKINIISEEPGLFKCLKPRCKLCSNNYIQECQRFETSNHKIWEVRCRITCDSINVLYFLTCNMCNGNTTKLGKTSTSFRARLNNHVSSCRTGETSDIFDKHVFSCGTANNCLREPFCKAYAFLVLRDADKLINGEDFPQQEIWYHELVSFYLDVWSGFCVTIPLPLPFTCA